MSLDVRLGWGLGWGGGQLAHEHDLILYFLQNEMMVSHFAWRNP